MIELVAMLAAIVIGYLSGRSAFLTMTIKGWSRFVSVLCGVVFGLFSWTFSFAGAFPYATGQENAFALTVTILAIFVIPWVWIVRARKARVQNKAMPPESRAEQPAPSPADRYQSWYAEAKRLGHSTGWDAWKKWESTGVFVTEKERRAQESVVVDYVLRNANKSIDRDGKKRPRVARKPFRVKKSLSVMYEDANGDVTDRTIDTLSFDGVKIEAWCRMRSEERTFYASRILCCIDESTGEVIDDVSEYLLSAR